MKWLFLVPLGALVIAYRLHCETDRFNIVFVIMQLPWFKKEEMSE